jgi:hypothetical protein
MDLYERPPVTYVAAIDECGFYHAHVPTAADFAENVPFGSGLPGGSGGWIWTSDASRYDIVEVVKWNAIDLGYNATSGTYQSYAGKTGGPYRFRCIGVNYDAGAHPNAIQNEFVAETTYVKGENFDKGVTPFGTAVGECWNNGGHLAMERDMTELVRAGLPNGTNNWIWTADASSWNNQQTIKWTAVEIDFTSYYSQYATWQGRGGSYSYRCAYYPLDGDYAGPADGKCVSGSACFTVEKGADAKVQVWTDAFDRSPANYITASKDCYDEGGHLPTVRDVVELVRSGLPNGSNNWLWTSDSVDTTGNHVAVMRWLGTNATYDGQGSTYANNSAKSTGTVQAYRCVFTNELR